MRCNYCVMDDLNDPDIRFDEEGFCNYCRDYIENFPSPNPELFGKIVEKIKRNGNRYDCLIGVSGGVDSSYVAYLALKYGLNPLLLSFDNGWDTEIAKRNVKKIVESTGFEIFEKMADFEEFRDLQLSMLKASVINVEMITDHAITACLYNVAKEAHIKYILTGVNYETEAIMPKSWGHRWNDLPNIKSIHKRYGSVPLVSYPQMSLLKRLYYHVFKGIRLVHPLNILGYNKLRARKVLRRQFDWENYGDKHHESLWTKFYQSYVLPEKFHVDKRKPHLSCLICSGQTSRLEALNVLREPAYPLGELKRDKAEVLRRLGLSEVEFDELMNLPRRNHSDFASDETLYRVLKRFA